MSLICEIINEKLNSFPHIFTPFSLWQNVRWKGYVPKSELNRIFKYLGPHTRALHLEGGDRLSEKNPTKPHRAKKVKRCQKGQGNGNQRLLEITDSVLGKIRSNCDNLESISFQSYKLDYFSRYLNLCLSKSIDYE